MVGIVRILSRPTAKPYRDRDIKHTGPPHLNENGHVDFEPGDIENPHNWSSMRRGYITVCAVLLVVNATVASSSPSGCILPKSIAESFRVSREAAGLTITVFLLGYCAGPLVFGPLSEWFGRRWIFYITFLLYIAFNFLCAFAPNFGALLVGRFLTGTFVSAPLSNSPGVLADLWGPIERANAMAGFSCMVWVGPALGPVISGFLELKKDWRWSFYVLLWLAGVSAVFMFSIPETYAPVILLHKARRIRKAKIPGYEAVRAPIEDTDRSLINLYKVALTRPWVILFDPISFLVAIYLSVVYLLLYMLFSIYPIVFQEKRGWNAGVGELPLIGTIVGAVLGALVILVDSHFKAKKMRAGVPLKPEDRLNLAMVGGVGFSISMFWLSWSAEYNSVHWVVPTLAGVFLATFMMLIFVAFLNYLVDTYLMFAASAVAANTIVRSAAGSSAPLFTNQMFSALGVGGGGSLIGGVAALLAVIPFAFYRYGEQIRIRSPFAPTEQRKKPAPDEEAGAAAQEEVQEEAVRQADAGEELTPRPSRSSSTVAGAETDAEKEEKKRDEEGGRTDVEEGEEMTVGRGRGGTSAEVDGRYGKEVV
ncbi:MFS general substrate transporter [Pleurostoma richardsiae]|uniref:MFS general substrate transporter n=1 Tax=Pleurostoma richardsiae TaxID=41990 RepID=A0AA38VH35_9PEZI|nr:MFS general substrate transporter [Pleurostoma richardsiae]